MCNKVANRNAKKSLVVGTPKKALLSNYYCMHILAPGMWNFSTKYYITRRKLIMILNIYGTSYVRMNECKYRKICKLFSFTLPFYELLVENDMARIAHVNAGSRGALVTAHLQTDHSVAGS